ncbi:hypothetical protein [Streptomyces sp. CBMA156]|uniref:hypothetical protein n=1 Tax=Streptomyces sp. CBMA156 TaxID=1930280 RepID=UPI001661E7F6|nr:hypothetical protein [Streptomyces sp. CBMA156]
MRSSAQRGRVYRRCGYRDNQRWQLGTWTFAVDSHSALDDLARPHQRGEVTVHRILAPSPAPSATASATTACPATSPAR